MKPLTIVLLCCMLSTPASRGGDRPALKWKNLTAGIAAAESSKKKILVDVYTDWCKWCKKMDSDVYGNDAVAGYLDRRYELVKLNAESSAGVSYNGASLSEAELAARFGVNSYPTTLFLDSTGQFLTPVSGFVPPDRFIHIARFIGESYFRAMSWDEYLKRNAGAGAE